MSTGEGLPVTAWSAVNSLGGRTAEVVSRLRRGIPAFSAPPPETNFPTVCGAVTAELARIAPNYEQSAAYRFYRDEQPGASARD